MADRVELDTLATIATASDARPHLISAKKDLAGRLVLTAHTSKATSSRRERNALLDNMRRSGVSARFRVRTHDARSLAKARSLEGLLKQYGRGEYLHDPMGVFGRSSGLLAFARLIRERSDVGIRGVYWQSRWRTVYVVLDPGDCFHDEKVKAADLARAEKTTFECLRDACGEEAHEFVTAVRLGFEMPGLPLVPVDDASYVRKAPWLMSARGFAVAPALAAMVGISTAGGAVAADLPMGDPGYVPVSYTEPAVSGPNGKFAIRGGIVDTNNSNTDGVGLVTGSYSIPLDHSFGFQIDGAAGFVDDDFVGGFGGHLFWRDPSVGLFGAVASFVAADGSNGNPNRDATRLGLEGEYYVDQFTIEAGAGYQFGKNTDDDFYGKIDLAWYATDDLRLSIGAETNPVIDSVRAGVEYQPGIEGWSGLALFADGAVGDDGFASILGGIRFYLGDDKSLKDRHRKDDPDNEPGSTILGGGVSYSG